jgi:hypothetical protein
MLLLERPRGQLIDRCSYQTWWIIPIRSFEVELPRCLHGCGSFDLSHATFVPHYSLGRAPMGLAGAQVATLNQQRAARVGAEPSAGLAPSSAAGSARPPWPASAGDSAAPSACLHDQLVARVPAVATGGAARSGSSCATIPNAQAIG